MDFEWTVAKNFEDLPEKKYINPCCVGSDDILEQLKPKIAFEMEVDESQIDIYQEDWGWALEFLKDDVSYLLAVNNNDESEAGITFFSAYTQATKQEKKLFFNKSVDADTELIKFSKIVTKIANEKGFKAN